MSDAEQQFETWFKQISSHFGTDLEQTCGSPTPWETEWGQASLLSQFPADGAGLDLICSGHPFGDQVKERLLELFSIAAQSDGDETEFERPEFSGGLTEAQVRELLLEYAANMRKIAELAESEDGIVGAGNPPELVNSDDLDNSHGLTVVWYAEMHDDLFGDRTNPLSYLFEPLYEAGGCSFIVPSYVLWPINSADSPLENAFLPAFTLWKHGVDWAFPTDGVIHYQMGED